MTRLTKEVVSALSNDLSEETVTIIVADLPDVLADPILIRQVLTNLLSNAIKYSRTTPGALIQITHQVTDGETIYQVSDNGAGFDMKQAHKLFGVFQRLHPAAEFEGTGVGLSIVERIIHRHGGRIWAEAAIGHGATFYFTVPASPTAMDALPVQRTERVPAPTPVAAASR